MDRRSHPDASAGTNLTQCPDPQLLLDVALGRTDAGQFEQIAAHLEVCADCLRRMEELDDSTDLLVAELARLRAMPSDQPRDVREWEAALPSIISQSGAPVCITTDAGRDLARRLLTGAVLLDRFELRTELGVGSFGYVFQAWDPRLERIVALKVQRAGSMASQEEVERFQREARSAARLKHPGRRKTTSGS
jgi:anti-sigma factor RsiW